MSTLIVNPQLSYSMPDMTPDQLDISSMTGPQAGPSLNPGIDLSPSTVASETAGGIPLATQVAGILGTTGGTVTTGILWVLGGLLLITLFDAVKTKGRRR